MIALFLENAYRIIAKNKKRSFLSMLGIGVGVFSLIFMSALSGAMKQKTSEELGKLGANMIVIAPGEYRMMGSRAMQTEAYNTLTVEDVRTVEQKIENIKFATPYVFTTTDLSSGLSSLNGALIGCEAKMQEIADVSLKCGRFIEDFDSENLSAVAVIGSKVATDLFGQECPIGRIVTINQKSGFTVVGVLNDKGTNSSGQNLDETVYIPLGSAMKRVLNQTFINAAAIVSEDAAKNNEIQRQAEKLLANRHGKYDFTVMQVQEVLEIMNASLAIFSNLGVIVAVVAYSVGALGIAAVMILSIYERMTEIGIRRAFGATKRDIFLQFLSESLFLSVAGAIVGAIVAVGLASIVQFFAGWGFYFPFIALLLAVFMSVFIGAVSGIYPALKAVSFEPKEILSGE